MLKVRTHKVTGCCNFVVTSLCKQFSLQQVEQNQVRLNFCDFLWQENSVVGSILEGNLSL